MLVIGLHGWFLHPIAILLCDMIVYSEFLIHPVVLLSTSTKLRTEVKHTLKVLFSQVQETLTLYLPTNLQYSHYLFKGQKVKICFLVKMTFAWFCRPPYLEIPAVFL